MSWAATTPPVPEAALIALADVLVTTDELSAERVQAAARSSPLHRHSFHCRSHPPHTRLAPLAFVPAQHADSALQHAGKALPSSQAASTLRNVHHHMLPLPSLPFSGDVSTGGHAGGMTELNTGVVYFRATRGALAMVQQWRKSMLSMKGRKDLTENVNDQVPTAQSARASHTPSHTPPSHTPPSHEPSHAPSHTPRHTPRHTPSHAPSHTPRHTPQATRAEPRAKPHARSRANPHGATHHASSITLRLVRLRGVAIARLMGLCERVLRALPSSPITMRYTTRGCKQSRGGTCLRVPSPSSIKWYVGR